MNGAANERIGIYGFSANLHCLRSQILSQCKKLPDSDVFCGLIKNAFRNLVFGSREFLAGHKRSKNASLSA